MMFLKITDKKYDYSVELPIGNDQPAYAYAA